jgi:hypothetical protein
LVFSFSPSRPLAVGLLLIGASGAGAQPRNSEQVVFSGVGGGSFGGGSPVGFWIWCQADSRNPYVGECSGSMYFYALGITKGVEGEVTELSEGVYVMDVQSRHGQLGRLHAHELAADHAWPHEHGHDFVFEPGRKRRGSSVFRFRGGTP